jgi:hypothetical protein
MTNLRELRLLVDLGNDLRKIAKIAFSKTDASLYIFPYAPTGQYFYGGRHMEEVKFEDKVRFTEDVFSDQVPKLSIHETGQVHIKAKESVAGPVLISPLSDWRGQHIASVSVDQFSSLAEFRDSISDKGPEIDHVIPADELVKSGRLVFYLASDRVAFEEPNCRIVITIARPTIENPIYIGIKPKAQDLLSDLDFGGITVLAGWDIHPEPGAGVNYLYIRGV